jgi:hypothetical protein
MTENTPPLNNSQKQSQTSDEEKPTQNYTLLKNQRRNQNIIFENYVFNVYIKSETNSVWRCLNRSCSEKGHLSDNQSFFSLIGNHNHQPEEKNNTFEI